MCTPTPERVLNNDNQHGTSLSSIHPTNTTLWCDWYQLTNQPPIYLAFRSVVIDNRPRHVNWVSHTPHRSSIRKHNAFNGRFAISSCYSISRIWRSPPLENSTTLSTGSLGNVTLCGEITLVSPHPPPHQIMTWLGGSDVKVANFIKLGSLVDTGPRCLRLTWVSSH